MKVRASTTAALLYGLSGATVLGAWYITLFTATPSGVTAARTLHYLVITGPNTAWFRWFLCLPILCFLLAIGFGTRLAESESGAQVLFGLGSSVTLASITTVTIPFVVFLALATFFAYRNIGILGAIRTGKWNELNTVLGLFIAAALLEYFALSEVVFWLLGVSTQWPVFPLLLGLAMPRFVTMMALLGVLGRFQRLSSSLIFLALYAVLLLVHFNQTEAFLNWDSTIATSRATVPYVAGLLGAILGLWLGRKAAGLRVVAVQKPEHN